MPEYSPTPWVYDDSRDGHEGTVAVWNNEGGLVVALGDMEDCTWADICDANLIAAAPDLLAALVALDQILELRHDHVVWLASLLNIKDPSGLDRAITLTRAAIAKAEGGA